jgi:catechol 2,3-dioxygenase-like lactoylglutathione lyase family enzyme
MNSLRKRAGLAAVACLPWGLAIVLASGQTPSPAGDTTKPMVIDTGNFTPFVENMDRSLAFYHDVFGMEVPPLPESGVRPYNNPNPRLFAWFDIPGAKERHQSARVPGIRTGVEAMEIRDVDHTTVRLRLQDPGNATLVLVVRDIEATMRRVTQANLPIVTQGGKPVVLADGAKAIVIRDIDNRFIEIRQPVSIPQTAPSGNIVEIRVSIAVNDMERTKQVYRNVFGFKVEGETAFTTDRSMQALTGLPQAEVRGSRVQARDSALWLELVEFRGVDRSPLHMRIQDRGAARLQLRTQNIDAVVSAVKSAGLTIVSQGGGAVPVPPNFRGALVADPNNFFVTLYEPCDGCAPRDQPSTK